MKDRDEIIKAAHQYAIEGRIDNAIAEYLKILPVSLDGNIHNIIGDLYLKKGSTYEAIKYFREAAVIFDKDESHTKAIALYHKILSINPDQNDVIIELAELNAERRFIKQAVEGLISAAEAYYSKGLPMKALRIYKKALAVSPSDLNLNMKIADLHLRTNHMDRAVKMYLAIAMEHEKNAESVQAEEIYKKVIILDPDNIESLTHLSRLAEDDHDLELAFEYMSRAVAIAPHNNDIMFDYSNLAAKANKDISEHLQQVPDGPDNKKSQNIQLPEAVNNCDIISNAHEPVDLSSEKNTTEHLSSGEPISAATSPLPIVSTGGGPEETGFTVPPDRGETGIEKNSIWDDIHYEDKNNQSVIDSIQGKTSKAVTGHETAEAEYDQNTEEYEFNMSMKEPVHEKTVKDSRRLKNRVKNNRLHVSLILFFVIVTGLSFYITFKFIKNTQTVEIETPKHVIPQEPLAITDVKAREGSSDTSKTSAQTVDIETPKHVIPQEPLALTDVKTRGSSSDTSKTSAQNKATEQVKTKTKAIKKEDNIKADDQEVLNLPVRETEPAINGGNTNADSTKAIALNEEDSNLADIQKEVIGPTMKSDSELVQEKENTNIDSEILTVPESIDEIQQAEEHKKEGTAIISFNEPFDNNDNNWEITETSSAHVRLEDGKYYILNMRESEAYIILNGPDISTDSEFEIESHLNSVNPTGDHSYGLIFGAKDKEDFFVFQILPEDNYSIKKYFWGVSLELAGGSINSTPESQDLFNVLKINSKENKLSFFINGDFVDEVSDISFSNRKTGFFIDGKTELVIDTILIHQQTN